MKGSEKFTVAAWRLRRVGGAAPWRLLDAHLAARRDAELPVHDDALAALHALLEDDEVRLPLSELDGTELRRIVLFHDVDERTLRRYLRRAGGHDDGRRQRGEDQPHLHEAARPEAPLPVFDGRPDRHGARAFLHGVVEERHLARKRVRGLVGQADLDVERLAGHPALHGRQVVLGDGEIDVDRVEPLDDEERSAVRGDDVPAVDEAVPRPAVDRRRDRTVLEVDPSGRERRLVLPQLRLGHVHRALLRVVVRLRDDLRGDELREAREVGAREVEHRLGPGDVRLGGGGRRAIRLRVDREEGVALSQIGAVLEVDLRDPAANLRLHGHDLARDALPDLVEVDGDVAGDGLRDRHGRGRALEGGRALLLAGAGEKGGEGKGESEGW